MSHLSKISPNFSFSSCLLFCPRCEGGSATGLSIKCQRWVVAEMSISFSFFVWCRSITVALVKLKVLQVQISRYHTSTPLPQQLPSLLLQGEVAGVLCSQESCQVVKLELCHPQLPNIGTTYLGIISLILLSLTKSYYCLQQAFLGMAAATLLLVAMASDAFVTAGPLAFPLVCTHWCCVMFHPACFFYCRVSKVVPPSVCRSQGQYRLCPDLSVGERFGVSKLTSGWSDQFSDLDKQGNRKNRTRKNAAGYQVLWHSTCYSPAANTLWKLCSQAQPCLKALFYFITQFDTFAWHWACYCLPCVYVCVCIYIYIYVYIYIHIIYYIYTICIHKVVVWFWRSKRLRVCFARCLLLLLSSPLIVCLVFISLLNLVSGHLRRSRRGDKQKLSSGLKIDHKYFGERHSVTCFASIAEAACFHRSNGLDRHSALQHCSTWMLRIWRPQVYFAQRPQQLCCARPEA